MRRTHKYADGGKIVKDHLASSKKPPRNSSSPGSPGLSGAIKDAVGAVADFAAPRSLKHAGPRTEQNIRKAGG